MTVAVLQADVTVLGARSPEDAGEGTMPGEGRPVMRTRPFALSLIAFSLLSTRSPAAAPPILNAVPEDAWVVVTLRDLGGLDAKLARLINPLMPMPIRPLLLLKAQLSMVEGIDESGTAAIALLPGVAGETEPTQVVMWVPTTDRTKLLAFLSPAPAEEGFEKVELRGQESYAGTHGRFTVLAGDLPVVRRAVREGPGVASRFTAHQLARFEVNDVSIYLNLAAIRTAPVFGIISTGLSLLGIPPGDVERYRSVQVSLRFEAEGVAIEVHSQTERAEENPPAQTDGSLLAELPAESFVLAVGMNIGGAGHDRSAPARLLLDGLDRRGMLDSARKADLEKALEKMYADVTGAALSVVAMPEGSDGLIGLTKVIHTKGRAQTLAASFEELISVLRSGVFVDPTVATAMQRITYTRNAETIAGTPVDHLSLDISGIQVVDEAAIRKAIGTEGALVRMGVVDDHRLVATFGGGAERFAAAITALRSVEGSLAADPLIGRSAAVKTKHHAEGYLAIDRALKLAADVTRAMDDPTVVPKMTPIDVPVSFLARRISPRETQIDVFVPTAVIVAVKQAAMEFVASKLSVAPPDVAPVSNR